MENTSYVMTYTVLAVVLSGVDLFFAQRGFRKNEKIGRTLGLSALFAALITLSYLVSIHVRSYRAFSVTSSIYFSCVTLMLLSFVRFVLHLTEQQDLPLAAGWTKIISYYAAFDALVLMINIFWEIAVSYVDSGGTAPNYSYQMKPLYDMHLIFTYSLILFIGYLLIRKARTVPRQYHRQYILIIMTIAAIVLVNAIFLYLDESDPLSQLDYSVFGYSVGLLMLYWSAYGYRLISLPRSLSLATLQNVNQGIVLFDYAGHLVLKNPKAEQFFPMADFSPRMTVKDMISCCGLPEEPPVDDEYDIPCERADGSDLQLLCDYNRLFNRKGQLIGHMFTFTIADLIKDFLTGFERWEHFHRAIEEGEMLLPHPTSVAVIDITGLGEVNRTLGREEGDRRIRNLSIHLRRIMPDDTRLLRGFEAHLVAVCPACTEEELSRLVGKLQEETEDSLIYGLSQTSEGEMLHGEASEERGLQQTIDTASRTLHAKKLLSSKSARSQTLSSLVKALEETDSDTEAHVQRTRRMGTVLGKRIGLNDAEQANLSLLCLLHDIGKIGVPLEILNKPGKLTDQEWTVLRAHAEKGYQIAMSTDELKPIAEMIRYHHERWDGKGYPDGLSGSAIPLLSRIISIVDTYDAMVNDRSYRKGRTPEQAQEEIRRCAGTQFDPSLAQEFLAMLAENPDIANGERTEMDAQVFISVPDQILSTSDVFSVPYSRYLLNEREIIVEADEQFQEVTGYAPEEVVGTMSQFELIPPEDRAFYITQVDNAFAKGSIVYLKHKIVRKGGDTCWVVCYGERYFDSAAKEVRNQILIFRSSSGL